MAYRRLFVFVEGDDDERFFTVVCFPVWAQAYDDIKLVQVSRMRRAKFGNYLRSVRAMGDYLVVRDLDERPCASAAKEELRQQYPSLDLGRIQIVKAEIESWYCAGIPKGHAEFGGLAIATCPDTEEVTKESFDAAVARSGAPRVPTLVAMLECFDRETAARRNSSFRYFLTKHLHLA